MSLLSELNFSRRKRLPIILGAEAAECGLVCMTMIAAYHRHDVDLNGMRQRFSLSMTGATLRSLMGLADQLGFSCRALRLEVEDLSSLALPAILHWNLDHFVVLKSIDRRGVVIHDPAAGARTLTLAQVSQAFSGVALELTPAADFTPIAVRAPVRLSSLFGKLSGFRSAATQVLLLSAALQIATFALPFQIQLVVDEAVLRGDRSLLTVLALGFGGIVIVQAIIELMRGWALTVFGQMMSFQMGGNLVRHLLKLPGDFFEKRHVGDILSRLGSANQIQSILTKGVVAAVIDGLMALVAGVILFVYSATLALVVFASVGLSLLLALALFPLMRKRQEEQIAETAREQSYLMETVRSATTLKLMGREIEREAGWRNRYARIVNAAVSVAKYQLGLAAAQTLISGLQITLVIFLGARAVLAGDGLSLGMLFAFLSFRQTFTDRTNALINQAIQFRFIGLHLDRVADIVAAEPEVRSMTASDPGFEVAGAVSLDAVSFRYGAADPFVIQDISLDITAGAFIAVTGPSGGGKTTLMKLMLGLQAPTAGEIRLDEQLASPDLWRAWRGRVGVVAQDDRLLSGSIADNIAFFDPDMDMRRVHAAAQSARVHDDILRMPMHYLSLVGDMGSALSGGQKQRVLLARALYRQPSVLVLDEGTANLDVDTEEDIAGVIAALPITRIVVAHRPALIRRADRVLVIERGRARWDTRTYEAEPI